MISEDNSPKEEKELVKMIENQCKSLTLISKTSSNSDLETSTSISDMSSSNSGLKSKI